MSVNFMVKYVNRLVLFLIFIVIPGMLICGCKKEAEPVVSNDPVKQIIVAGVCHNYNTSEQTLVYWSNKNMITVETSGQLKFQCRGVFTSGNDVYIAGGVGDINGNYRPCYWKNGVRNELLTVSGDTFVNEISVDNGNVAALGTFSVNSGNACYWKDNSVHTETAAYITWASLVFDQGRIILGGTENGPAYWIDGVKQQIGPNGQVFGITAKNGVPITCGHSELYGIDTACYWENTTPHTLNAQGIIAFKIIYDGADQYIFGHKYGTVYIWKNGVLSTMNAGASATIYGYTVYGHKVYIAANDLGENFYMSDSEKVLLQAPQGMYAFVGGIADIE